MFSLGEPLYNQHLQEQDQVDQPKMTIMEKQIWMAL
jgi:hypothetical protein